MQTDPILLERQRPDRPVPIGEGLLIRATRISDFEEVAALINMPLFRSGTLRLPHQSPDEVRKWMETSGSGHTSIVATLEGRIVGKADLMPSTGRRSHTAKLGIGVHDDFHGRGVGSVLMRELVSAADDWLGLKRIELTVFTDNAPAIALYKRFGFELEGTHRAYAFRNGAFADTFAMARLRL
jgi:putative acetyltransferase